jgi:uncharacterized protein
MYPTGNIFIDAPHGRIESILKEPAGERRGVALVLHPHPLFGGTMHNKVVFRASRGLNDAGITTLRINFRGVGLSTGEHDHAQGGEQEDAQLALDYLVEKYPNVPVLVAGFSFGARVGLEVGTRDERVRFLIGIGTPVSIRERDYDFSFLSECRKPLLLVHGERDEFGATKDLLALAAQLPPGTNVQVKIIRGAGHFFDEQLDELRRTVAEWTEETFRGYGL